MFLLFIARRRMDSGEERMEISVKSSFQLSLPPHLISPSSSIKLNETIGQGSYDNFMRSQCHGAYAAVIKIITLISGEFGIVYKGYIKKGDITSVDEYLAIKTLKGVYTRYIH